MRTPAAWLAERVRGVRGPLPELLTWLYARHEEPAWMEQVAAADAHRYLRPAVTTVARTGAALVAWTGCTVAVWSHTDDWQLRLAGAALYLPFALVLVVGVGTVARMLATADATRRALQDVGGLPAQWCDDARLGPGIRARIERHCPPGQGPVVVEMARSFPGTVDELLTSATAALSSSQGGQA